VNTRFNRMGWARHMSLRSESGVGGPAGVFEAEAFHAIACGKHQLSIISLMLFGMYGRPRSLATHYAQDRQQAREVHQSGRATITHGTWLGRRSGATCGRRRRPPAGASTSARRSLRIPALL